MSFLNFASKSVGTFCTKTPCIRVIHAVISCIPTRMNVSGPGVKGLCSRFEEKPEQHGQKPVKKPKPAARTDLTVKNETIENTQPSVPPKPIKQSDVVGRQQKANKEPAALPEVMKTLVVFYDGQELPREFTGQDGQVYRLQEIPTVIRSPPKKPPKPEKGLHIVLEFFVTFMSSWFPNQSLSVHFCTRINYPQCKSLQTKHLVFQVKVKCYRVSYQMHILCI